MTDKTQNPEYRELEARIEDYTRKSDRGELQISSFLTPMQIFFAKEILKYKGMLHRAVFLGGYDGAERARLVLLPSFADSRKTDFPKVSSEDIVGRAVFRLFPKIEKVK